MSLSLYHFLLGALIYQVTTMVSITTFSTLLYIPGTAFSLTNFTYDMNNLEQYYDIQIAYQLTQVFWGFNRLPLRPRAIQSTTSSISKAQTTTLTNLAMFLHTHIWIHSTPNMSLARGISFVIKGLQLPGPAYAQPK